MCAAEARVQTRDASRYLIRLCRHAGKMGRGLGHQPRGHADGGAPPEIRSAQWSDTDGYLVLGLGRCTLRAAGGVLTIRAEASTPENLARIQELIGRRVESFGRREGLTVSWQTQVPGGSDIDAASSEPAGDAGA